MTEIESSLLFHKWAI